MPPTSTLALCGLRSLCDRLPGGGDSADSRLTPEQLPFVEVNAGYYPPPPGRGETAADESGWSPWVALAPNEFTGLV